MSLKSKVWLTDWFTEWQCHLLSCPGQLKTQNPKIGLCKKLNFRGIKAIGQHFKLENTFLKRSEDGGWGLASEIYHQNNTWITHYSFLESLCNEGVWKPSFLSLIWVTFFLHNLVPNAIWIFLGLFYCYLCPSRAFDPLNSWLSAAEIFIAENKVGAPTHSNVPTTLTRPS